MKYRRDTNCHLHTHVAPLAEVCVRITKDIQSLQLYLYKRKRENISGGESQRIGIARMLLRKPHVLILDEVNSALDEATRKTIVISHNNDFDKYCNKMVEL